MNVYFSDFSHERRCDGIRKGPLTKLRDLISFDIFSDILNVGNARRRTSRLSNSVVTFVSETL